MKTKIEKDKYEGYLWYSNQNTPQVFQDDELELILDDETNPFIIEGQLCNQHFSYSIKYIDGHYWVKKYDLKNFVSTVKTTQSYLPNFKALDGQRKIQKLMFNQYWRPQVDENCEGMSVLQPTEFVFVGFNYTEEQS